MARKKVETIVKDKIKPFLLKDKDSDFLDQLSRQYSYRLLVNSIDEATKYLEYDENGQVIEASIQRFLKKIDSIAHNKSLPLIEQKIVHIDNKGKKYIMEWDSQEACVLLQACVKGLKSLRWSNERIVKEFLEETLTETRNVEWSTWFKKIKKFNNKIKKSIKNDNRTIKQSGTILPEGLFVELPHNFGSICKQINASYENHLYDCTAVMMRHLLEILLVLSYQKANIENEIMASDGKHHVPLDSMIKNAVNNSKLALSLSTKNDMRHFKDLGNYSAHKIWYSCTKGDLEPHILKYRAIIEELFYKSGIKK